jgi:AraC-like DNA-binding protein
VLSQEDLPEVEARPHRQGWQSARPRLDCSDACNRLLDLVDTPEDIPFLSPLIQREIIYRLLKTSRRLAAFGLLRQVEISCSERQEPSPGCVQILRSLFSVEELANTARMGVSTLHHQFRALTSMSPLQYQKMLRLQTARERMLMDGLDATTAAYEVGYESISQLRKAGHGNDRVWKAWKAMKPASHPSHTLWKSLRDSHIPTASTTGYMSSRAPSTRTIATARGL